MHRCMFDDQEETLLKIPNFLASLANWECTTASEQRQKSRTDRTSRGVPSSVSVRMRSKLFRLPDAALFAAALAIAWQIIV